MQRHDRGDLRLHIEPPEGGASGKVRGGDGQNRVDYVYGLARNKRLMVEIEAELKDAPSEVATAGKHARRFKDFIKPV